VAGWLTCQPTLPSTDVCDGLDNDCDGEVDNGTPAQLGEDLPCTNMCGEGISKCIEGTVRCATLAGEWPIDSCDSTPVDPDAGTADASTGDLGGSASGGCDCRATPDTHRSVFAPAPALSPWMLLVVLTVLLIRKGVRH
jgi:hypothetical protein